MANLVGTLKSPTGGNATGKLTLTPPSGVSRVGFGGGQQGVPQNIITIDVIAGVLQSPPVVLGNDQMLPPSTAYYAKLVESNGRVSYGQWEITGTNYDVSTSIPSVATPGIVDSIVAGANITVDNTNPAHPVISATGGGGGGISSIVAGSGISVDATDPTNPIVSATGGGGTPGGPAGAIQFNDGAGGFGGSADFKRHPNNGGITLRVNATQDNEGPNGLYIAVDAGVFDQGDVWGLLIDSNAGSGAITNSKAIEIFDQTGATNNFSIKTGLGLVQLGNGDINDRADQSTSVAVLAKTSNVGYVYLTQLTNTIVDTDTSVYGTVDEIELSVDTTGLMIAHVSRVIDHGFNTDSIIAHQAKLNLSGVNDSDINGYTTLIGVGATPSVTAYYAGNTNVGGAVAQLFQFYANAPMLTGGGSISEAYLFWGANLASKATNPYYSWFDSRGVRRVKEDSTFDSVGQAIDALYNPQFTKYTPGAADFERVVLGQWNGNVAEIGMEKGGTGTLRSMRLLGTDLKFGDASGGTFEVGDATKAAGIHVQGAGAFDVDTGGTKSLLWLDADDATNTLFYLSNRIAGIAHGTSIRVENDGSLSIYPDDGNSSYIKWDITTEQWRFNNSSLQVQSWISTLRNTAPADGDIAANELADWFDPTNGAAFAMFKGKTANGTVVTGGFGLNTVSAPSPSTIVLPTSVYGGSAQLLGGPTAWGTVKVNGTQYKIPLY